MKKTKVLLGLLTIISLFSAGCKNRQTIEANELTVSAAASLKEPLEEVIKRYEKEASIKVNLNSDASGSLQKQIEQGAPVDLFISAGKGQVDALLEKGLADKSTYSEVLKNSLVLIVSNDYEKTISSMEALKEKDIKLVLGETATVPVGQYSKQFLEKTNLWTSFQNKIIYAKDVKSVLNYVENGEAEAGIVYSSDAVNLKSSYIAYRIPEDTHSPVVYPMAVMENSKNKTSARDFLNFLQKEDVEAIFKKYNFDVKDN
jgi:molybdate transport system substrate-binding protein